MKHSLLLTILAVLVLASCDSFEMKELNSDGLTSDLFEGIYLSDEVFFPQDTLVLKKFQLSDSSTKKKLLVHFKNDSLFLSNYGFGGWYGKWFCDFYNAKAKFTKDKLIIHATNLFHPCKNEDVWQEVEYQLIDSTDNSLTAIKTLDSTNCLPIETFRNVMTHLGRGGRNFTPEGGEEIRSDIQLR